MRMTRKIPTAMTARTTATSFFITTTNLWSDAFLAGWVISTTMTTTTTDNDSNNGDNDDLFDKDGNKDPNGGERKDNNKQRPIFLKKEPTCGQMHYNSIGQHNNQIGLRGHSRRGQGRWRWRRARMRREAEGKDKDKDKERGRGKRQG